MSRVRIVGGQWRSRLLPVARLPGLRPTPDRVRETLFNWLGQDLHGWHCLDLFAGTGVLGFEAASRGAARVTLVERDARAVAALRESARILGAEQVEVVRADAVEFARSASGGFDLVFLDPPYRQGLLERIEPELERLVAPDGWLYAESEQPLTRLGHLQTVREGRAGQVRFHLMRGSSE
ncbi:16S rRNA (guanine(966)-N(2))-methyltransferase RsmD [Pseudazoarcus pumilus]|uniref:16S rRNA (Guanine(966)-N(2))-methyltransferase RsmD n=1 Tax=Pseudazoarcus pumilus TaxID=2067960 RepID=A0A2I6S4Z1_9RHOO|nr:16S rRNA (guanine(966)-N(2))-methyltransferase RsmD [Pseudazoarcus pumilus]AUN94322.1 16S rRNA (guanine(966)-N(2))-methyltransferase RsmD [Pseudazoarcus pumilus]